MTNFFRPFLVALVFSVSCITLAPLSAEGIAWVSIQGNVHLADGAPICAMVLANGQHMFSCDGAGSYNLTVPPDESGEITLFSFADGFAPFGVTDNPGSLPSTIPMQTAAPDSPSINVSSHLAHSDVPSWWIRISGDIRSDGGVPLCALVLANGQHMFSCNESLGHYSLTVPPDENDQVTLFAFADGFQPYSQIISARWPNHCGDGRIDRELDTFDNPLASPDPWIYCCSHDDKASVTLREVAGCSGNALAVDYAFNGPYGIGADWLVILRSLQPPENLASYTHLRLALRNATTDTHHSLQVKLANRASDGKEYVYWIVAESVLDLSVWRPLYIDLKEFTCVSPADEPARCDNAPPLDPAEITRIEIGIARCIRSGEECEPGADQGTLYLDELALVDLRPGGTHRLIQTDFAQVTPNEAVSRQAAAALLEQQDSNGLCPAWFDESTPNYNTYSQALCLLVYATEFEKTGQVTYGDAANRLADALLAIQIPPGKTNAGAWFTAYSPSLVSADASCTGDEVFKKDRDRCSWIGNTAWAAIGLARLRTSNIFDDPSSLDMALERASAWMLSQRGSVPPFSDLVAYGLEGNISTYFALMAAGKNQEASLLGDAVYGYGWNPVERRMKIGARLTDLGTAMDTAGSWGVQFLRAIGKEREALDSLGFATTVLRTESFSDSNAAAGFVDGYGDIAGPWTMTVEFGAQGAAAGILDADYAMSQILLLQRKGNQTHPGSFPGSTDEWRGGTVVPWTTTMPGVAPTAWVYFALEGDPLNSVAVKQRRTSF